MNHDETLKFSKPYTFIFSGGKIRLSLQRVTFQQTIIFTVTAEITSNLVVPVLFETSSQTNTNKFPIVAELKV